MKAKRSAVAWNLFCPACDADLPVPHNGSFMWTPKDLLISKIKVVCPGCNRKITIQ